MDLKDWNQKNNGPRDPVQHQCILVRAVRCIIKSQQQFAFNGINGAKQVWKGGNPLYRLVKGANKPTPTAGHGPGLPSACGADSLSLRSAPSPHRHCCEAVEMMWYSDVWRGHSGGNIVFPTLASFRILMFFVHYIIYNIEWLYIVHRPILTLDAGLCCRFFSRFTQRLLILTLFKGNPVTKLLPFVYNHFAFMYGLAPAAPGKGT